jgi:hypothetical protein
MVALLFPLEHVMTIDPQDSLSDFTPARLRPRRDGWSAQRQRVFIEALAESGCVSDACVAAGVTPRSAYRLRRHPTAKGFTEAWDRALMIATGRLVSIAFDRAIKGTIRELWKDGECVGEVRAPSDKLLMFLLSKLDARRFGSLAGLNVASEDPLALARRALPLLVDGLSDIDLEADPLAPADYRPPALTDADGLARDMS